MKNNFPTIWRFLLPVLILLALAPFVLIKQQTSQQLDGIHASANEQAKSLVRLLNVTGELVGDQADAAMNLLKERWNITVWICFLFCRKMKEGSFLQTGKYLFMQNGRTEF